LVSALFSLVCMIGRQDTGSAHNAEGEYSLK
jgi:hypothetical protein